MYGRIFKTLHILSYVDVDETYRRDIKGIRNLQEGRYALARKICHGKKCELYHRYERGLENQHRHRPTSPPTRPASAGGRHRGGRIGGAMRSSPQRANRASPGRCCLRHVP